MATRLYPLTTNKANLEKLADVPEGTHSRLDALEAKTKLQDHFGSEFHSALEADPDMQKLYHFNLFGWGRVQWPITDYCGSTTDPELVANMLADQGEATQKNLALCEGLGWS